MPVLWHDPPRWDRCDQDLAFALPRAPVEGLQRSFTEKRRLDAKHIIEHLKVSNWWFERGPPAKAHGIKIDPSR